MENTPSVGSLMLVSYTPPPKYWALCDGQLLPINRQTEVLFGLIGNKFGGDGRTTFALPNLSGDQGVRDANGVQLYWVIATAGSIPVRG